MPPRSRASLRLLLAACCTSALLLLASVRTASAAGAGATPVDDASFDALVLASREAWVLEFWSPRCGTCADFAPLYTTLATRHAALARFGAVDIDTPAGMALAQRLDILSEGVPNVRAFVTAGAATDDGGARVFSGWEVPQLEVLDAALLTALGVVRALLCACAVRVL
jgi:thiol-disulfide isomerase/thioredoxin